MTLRHVIALISLTAGTTTLAEETTLVSDARLELPKGKGSIGLKSGTVVDVVGKEGDSAIVIYRKIQGHIPLKAVNLPANTPERSPAEQPAAPAAPAPKAAPANSAAPAKPAEAAKPAPAPSDKPTTMYGKAVKKARDNEGQHKENLVNPADEVSGAKK